MDALRSLVDAEQIADAVAGAVREGATELSAAAKLEEYRRESADYLEPSFDPILAYGPPGAS